MLDKEVKEKWVTALRSGNYKQCENQLHNEEDNTYCCLGVFREVTGFGRSADAYLLTGTLYDSNELYETYMDKEDPELGGLSRRNQDILSNMNDGNCGHEKHDFNQIADYIEENL